MRTKTTVVATLLMLAAIPSGCAGGDPYERCVDLERDQDDLADCCEEIGTADCEDGLLPLVPDADPDGSCPTHYCYAYNQAGCYAIDTLDKHADRSWCT